MGKRMAGRALQALIATVLSEYGDTCHLCGRAGATTIDHVIPVAAGGDYSLENLRPAHASCNSSRGAMSLANWFARHPLHAGPRASPSRNWYTP
ncbi:HNH endonuclease [Corynebacterium striatum]|uniref:HNH endonuclease n=1 Tax=Corynebacterium striatum TaxID=43770 RepID=UPI003B5B0354